MLPNKNIVLNPALEIDILRTVCSKSFYRFVQEFWHLAVGNAMKDGKVMPGGNMKDNWHIEYLCKKLQEMFDLVVDGKPKKHDLIINIPPGMSKSTIFSILFPCYVHARMPTARFITASFEADLATGFALKSKQVMKSDLYRKCFGRFRFTPERMGHYTNDEWDTQVDGKSIMDKIAEDYGVLANMYAMPYLPVIKKFYKKPHILSTQVEEPARKATTKWLKKHFKEPNITYVGMGSHAEENAILHEDDRIFDDHPKFPNSPKLITVGHGYNKGKESFRISTPEEMEAILEVLKIWD